jgi:DNA repair protein RadC
MLSHEQEEQIIEQALSILTSRLKQKTEFFSNAKMVKSFLRLQLEQKEREHFSVMFLDSQNRLIEYQVMFMGTIDSATISPREIVKAALRLNARSLIVAHNHPSGLATPSQQDIRITKVLVSALDLVEIKLLDHMVIGHDDIISLSEQQLM